MKRERERERETESVWPGMCLRQTQRQSFVLTIGYTHRSRRPPYTPPYTLRVVLYRNHFNFFAAEAWREHIKLSSPQKPSAWLALARCLHRVGDTENGVLAAAAALEFRPFHQPTRALLSVLDPSWGTHFAFQDFACTRIGAVARGWLTRTWMLVLHRMAGKIQFTTRRWFITLMAMRRKLQLLRDNPWSHQALKRFRYRREDDTFTVWVRVMRGLQELRRGTVKKWKDYSNQNIRWPFDRWEEWVQDRIEARKVTKTQSVARRWLVRHWIKRRSQAAFVIQMAWRGHLAKFLVAKAKAHFAEQERRVEAAMRKMRYVLRRGEERREEKRGGK